MRSDCCRHIHADILYSPFDYCADVRPINDCILEAFDLSREYDRQYMIGLVMYIRVIHPIFQKNSIYILYQL